MSRPWSRAEIEEKIPDSLERLNEAVTNLLDLGRLSAEAKWDYEKHWATCLLKASDVGKNAAEREAIAVQLLVSMGNGKPHPGLAKDLSANAYADQRRIIDAIQTDLDVMRTLLVSARETSRNTGA